MNKYGEAESSPTELIRPDDGRVRSHIHKYICIYIYIYIYICISGERERERDLHVAALCISNPLGRGLERMVVVGFETKSSHCKLAPQRLRFQNPLWVFLAEQLLEHHRRQFNKGTLNQTRTRPKPTHKANPNHVGLLL